MKASEEIKLIFAGYKKSEIAELKKREAEELSGNQDPPETLPKVPSPDPPETLPKVPSPDPPETLPKVPSPDPAAEEDPAPNQSDKDYKKMYEEMQTKLADLQKELKAAQKNNVNNNQAPAVDSYKADTDMLLDSLRQFT